MMKTRKIGVAALILAAAAFTAGAQDSKTALHPEFSSDVTFSSGLQNLNGNSELEEIPGVSSEYDADVNFTLKGAFSRASEWGVEKEDGITYHSGVGYEVGLGVDMSTLYAVASGSSSYSDSSDTNKYSLIQPMIDWYEANRARYNLPASPFDELTASQPWPTTAYGNSTGRYQFIQGTTVERADDVNWTSDKFDDALCLYNDIKYAINSTLDQLYCDTMGFATGSINQIEYDSMTETEQHYAQLKMKAKREFSDVASGKVSAETLADAISSAYIKVTNLAGIADMRVDFAGQRLTAGNNITSYLAGQSTTGAALTFSLKNGLVQGLTAEVSAGIAGGEAQDAENYDTAKLDYWSGLTGELAVKGKAQYMKYFEGPAATLTVNASAIASDLLCAKMNGAADVVLGWQSTGFFSYGVNAEGLVLNYKDRTDDDAEYQLAYSGAADINASIVGATLKASGAYKSAYFTHETTSAIEDRFYGYSLDSDYYIANLKSAVMAKAELEFNPQYFLLYDVLTVNAGASALLYDFNLTAMGVTLKANIDFQDLTRLPVNVYCSADYYRNTAVAEWSDMSSLPERDLIDFTKLKAGISMRPVSEFTLSLDYVSTPSLSRRNSERISSVMLNGTISF